MSCNFCKEIGHMNDIEKSAKHSDCFLFKDSASNIGFGMHIGDATYVTGIDFCPYCGRKLKEECSIVDSECEHCACELLDQRDEAREEAERYKRYYFHHEYDKWKSEIKADTVQKMQERLKEYLDDFYTTDEDALLDVPDLIDQIAKEMLEVE